VGPQEIILIYILPISFIGTHHEECKDARILCFTSQYRGLVQFCFLSLFPTSCTNLFCSACPYMFSGQYFSRHSQRHYVPSKVNSELVQNGSTAYSPRWSTCFSLLPDLLVSIALQHYPSFSWGTAYFPGLPVQFC